ncbi:phytoene/squalene synthase family protein [Algivirga pacifica]|uniref:Phytoene/squalene synthase family protein n=1 Tax=Algivirga pacifica TaxID=1162670 RepID=A0ABP9DJL4_9BACT
MKKLFDEVSLKSSEIVTRSYSTSFSLAVRMLAPSIRGAIYGIYGFVRFADEIVDTFHDYPKEQLLDEFTEDYYTALERGISMNPILNSFIAVVKEYNIQDELVRAFLKSMRMDLHKSEYNTQKEYEEYIYGSADVVGLMCLKVFVNGDEQRYEALKDSAMRLGSAFQKVNFLRDLKNDVDVLDRTYFPGIDLKNLTPENKAKIIQEIEEDFNEALKGIQQLPLNAKFGVYTAYVYYRRLLTKLRNTPSEKIITTRVRVSNPMKLGLIARCYCQIKLNMI